MKKGLSKLKIVRNNSMFLERFKGKISFVSPTGVLEPFEIKDEKDQSEIENSRLGRRFSVDLCKKKKITTKIKEHGDMKENMKTVENNVSRIVTEQEGTKKERLKSVKLPRLRSRSHQDAESVKGSIDDQMELISMPSHPVSRQRFSKKRKVYINQQYSNIILQRLPKQYKGLRI